MIRKMFAIFVAVFFCRLPRQSTGCLQTGARQHLNQYRCDNLGGTKTGSRNGTI